MLVASTPLLDDAPPQGMPTLHYVGPIFEPDDPAHEKPPPEIGSATQPLVLVGVSTSYIEGQQDLLTRIIKALGHLPVRGIVTAGQGVDLGSLPSFANVSTHQFVPHNLLLPDVSLLITHAGHSSVVRGLSFGVPLVCIPLGRDQPFNAQRVQAIGVGLALAAEAPPEAIALAIQAVLADASYANAARQAAATITAAGRGEEEAANLVENIAH